VVASGKRVLFLFSDHEPVEAELHRSGNHGRLTASAKVTFGRIAVRDHTLRPVWAQREAHAALDVAVLRELEQARGRDAVPAHIAGPAGDRHLAA